MAYIRHPVGSIFWRTIIQIFVYGVVGFGLLQHLIQCCTGELVNLIRMDIGDVLVDGRGVGECLVTAVPKWWDLLRRHKCRKGLQIREQFNNDTSIPIIIWSTFWQRSKWLHFVVTDKPRVFWFSYIWPSTNTISHHLSVICKAQVLWCDRARVVSCAQLLTTLLWISQVVYLMSSLPGHWLLVDRIF